MAGLLLSLPSLASRDLTRPETTSSADEDRTQNSTAHSAGYAARLGAFRGERARFPGWQAHSRRRLGLAVGVVHRWIDTRICGNSGGQELLFMVDN
jgi:hypothetical protein